MNALKTFFANYWHVLLALLVLIVLVYLIYRSGKKSGSGNYTVVDDQGHPVGPTAEQQQQALDIATRIHTDLNSGWFDGYNFFGNIGRDSDAYETFATMSDTMFTYTAQVYHDKFTGSIIADIDAESSLPSGSGSNKQLILDKAHRLNIN